MKYILPAILVLSAFTACDGPNHAASNRISTAPNSQDPTETLPPTGQNNTTTDHKIQPKTGSAPANEQLPTGTGNPAGSDSTAKN